MTPMQAAQLVSLAKTAWPAGDWNQARFNLWAERLLDLPFADAAAEFDAMVDSWPETWAPSIGRIKQAILARADRRRKQAAVAAERKLLAGPRDPAVGQLLRATVLRLEARSRSAGAPHAESQRGAGERKPGQAARSAAGVGEG